MARTVFTLHVDYDPKKTDPEALATALDRLLETALSTPGILEEYDDLTAHEFCPVTLANLDLAVEVPDEAGEGGPLTMRVRGDGYGISVEALNDHGQPLGGVGLDYHSNRLQGLVDVGWDNEPAVIHPLCEDVSAARKEDLRQEQR